MSPGQKLPLMEDSVSTVQTMLDSSAQPIAAVSSVVNSEFWRIPEVMEGEM